MSTPATCNGPHPVEPDLDATEHHSADSAGAPSRPKPPQADLTAIARAKIEAANSAHPSYTVASLFPRVPVDESITSRRRPKPVPANLPSLFAPTGRKEWIVIRTGIEPFLARASRLYFEIGTVAGKTGFEMRSPGRPVDLSRLELSDLTRRYLESDPNYRQVQADSQLILRMSCHHA